MPTTVLPPSPAHPDTAPASEAVFNRARAIENTVWVAAAAQGGGDAP